MTQAATEPTTTTAAMPADEPKLDFAKAAAGVWTEDAKPKTETIEATAPETAETEPATETQAKDPKEDRVATRITIAKRAEQKSERERIELKQLRDAQDKRQAEQDAREKKLKLVEEDPVKFFEVYGVDPKVFLDKLAGDYKPENVATKKLTAVEEKVQRLEAEIAQRDEATKQAAARAHGDSAWKAASADFIAFVGEQSDKYPHLTEEFTEDQATEMAYSMLTEVLGKDSDGTPVTRSEAYRREHGVYPNHEAVAEYLNDIAQKRVEARSKSAWRKQGSSATSGSQPSSGDLKAVPSVSGTSPRTLKARDGSTRASPPREWTQEWADEESKRLLAVALSKNA